MIILLIFAFIAGVVTVLSPCILPILPLVLSGSVGQGKARPLGVVAGFIASFSFFTLTLSTLVKATGIPSDALRNVAVVMIVLLGLSMILPQTQVFLEILLSKLSGLAPKQTNRSGFFGGVILGLTLGLVWAPCVGPILAAVITLAATSSITLTSVMITISYAIGTALPMLAITYGGRQLLQRNPVLLKHAADLQRGFGVVMIIVGIGLFFQVDRTFQALILQKFPQYGSGLTGIEQNAVVKKQLTALTGKADQEPNVSAELVPPIKKAPEFIGGATWINSAPLRLKEELKGKVVLVDFWTYSCVNCIRTFPYLRQWYTSYKDKGLVIVGVHSPEFEFEKKTENVKKAAADFQLSYPIVQDNDFALWQSYSNQYWPAHYLIDKNGYIRYMHFGEGNYDRTEAAIRLLLGESAKDTPMSQLSLSQPNPVVSIPTQTQETYLGWGRAGSYTTENQLKTDQSGDYSFSHQLAESEVGLQGKWSVLKENIVADADQAAISINFKAKHVYLVLSSQDGAAKQVQIKLDGKNLTVINKTADTTDQGALTIKEARKYDIVTLPDMNSHLLEISFQKGSQVYAFTFGS